jgi:hypothetical protein
MLSSAKLQLLAALMTIHQVIFSLLPSYFFIWLNPNDCYRLQLIPISASIRTSESVKMRPPGQPLYLAKDANK